MELTLGEEQITTFRQALERVSALAHAKLPQELHGHLERAHALVLHRHVFPTDDGKHAQVLSSDGACWYPVNGHCTCMDAPKAPQGLCKHRLAFGLYRRASELLVQSGSREWGIGSRGESEPHCPLPTAHSLLPTPTPLPEAPASANTHLLIEGHTVQVTLRDIDEERLLVRLAALLARYPAAACGGKAKTHEASAPAQTTQSETPTCVYHGAMKESTKIKGTWFCPSKMGDGSYCKEKFPKT